LSLHDALPISRTPVDAKRAAGEILGMTIKGYTVREVWCETAQEIVRELYLGLTLDRDARKPVLILSAQGGMDIEEVAQTRPDAIAKLHPDPWRGPLIFEVRDLIFRAGLGPLQAQLMPPVTTPSALGRTSAPLPLELPRLALPR